MAVTYKTATDGETPESPHVALARSREMKKKTATVSPKDPRIHRMSSTWSTTLALADGGLKNSR